jgi:3'(2'),5'-bisphosphate nucleotidase
MQHSSLARALILPARAAGEIALAHRSEGIRVIEKPDGSPVTPADGAMEALILEALSKLAPGVPVVAEEEAAAGRVPDISGGTFFLVDPLDGTQDFIARGNDFTVNIALMENFRPVLGLIYGPARGMLYFAAGKEAFLLRGDGETPVRARRAPEEGLTVVVSSRTGRTAALLQERKVRDVIRRSGALKFCMVAEGSADLYPRFGRTYEWDTAAGEAILNAAGGHVTTLDGAPMRYGKVEEKFENPGFIASA